jgi:hypothetical protein
LRTRAWDEVDNGVAAKLFLTNDTRDGGTFDYWQEFGRIQTPGIQGAAIAAYSKPLPPALLTSR